MGKRGKVKDYPSILTVRIPQEMASSLRAIAAMESVSVGDLVRRYIDDRISEGHKQIILSRARYLIESGKFMKSIKKNVKDFSEEVVNEEFQRQLALSGSDQEETMTKRSPTSRLDELDNVYAALTTVEAAVTKAESREARMKKSSGVSEKDQERFPAMRRRSS
jgi:hypothetical protein